MHEISVLESLVESIRPHLPPDGLLKEVRIDVGALEHLDTDVMEMAWQALTQGTSFQGVVLIIQKIAMKVRCQACEREYFPEDMALLKCPHCDAVRPDVIEGTGILLRSLEVETPPLESSD